ncbi:hypothetical protein [Nitrosopumilus sp. S6]
MNTKNSCETNQKVNEPTVEVCLNSYTVKRICKNCGNKFEYRASDYCSSECAFEDVEQIITNGN